MVEIGDKENKLKTKDGRLEVALFDNHMVEIESPDFRNVSVEVKTLNSADPLTPFGALYEIYIYSSLENAKEHVEGYDIACILSNGKIIRAGKEYKDHMHRHNLSV
jgi:hypothetical protein